MLITESGEIAQQLNAGSTSSEDLSWFPAKGIAQNRNSSSMESDALYGLCGQCTAMDCINA